MAKKSRFGSIFKSSKKEKKTEQNLQSNEGILPTLLGMFTFNNVNVCASDEQSFYCKFMRFFQLFVAMLVFGIILYFIYNLISSGMVGGSSKIGGG